MRSRRRRTTTYRARGGRSPSLADPLLAHEHLVGGPKPSGLESRSQILMTADTRYNPISDAELRSDDGAALLGPRLSILPTGHLLHHDGPVSAAEPTECCRREARPEHPGSKLVAVHQPSAARSEHLDLIS